MAQEVRHTTKYNDNSSTETLLAGEIVYTDSSTIKVGDGEHIFSQLPEFSSNDTLGDDSTIKSNSAKKIQAHGTLNKNPNATGNYTKVFDWIGTAQEFVDQHIESEHPDWLCFVTDDISAVSDGTYTRSQIDNFLANKADGQGSAVLTSGSQSIEGFKYFLNDGLKSKSGTIDSTQTPTEEEYLENLMAHDKNGVRIGCFFTHHRKDTGAIGAGINSSVNINGSNVFSGGIKTWISQDGLTKWTETITPTNTTANDTQIATTEHVINVLKVMYPVGAIFIGTTSTCPMAQFFGTWELVAADRSLQGSSTNHAADTTIAAGLPNITGTIGNLCVSVSGEAATPAAPTGAFGATRAAVVGGNQAGQGRWIGYLDNTNIDASRSSSIYGNSTTVQPSAYIVNVWRRTA